MKVWGGAIASLCSRVRSSAHGISLSLSLLRSTECKSKCVLIEGWCRLSRVVVVVFLACIVCHEKESLREHEDNSGRVSVAVSAADSDDVRRERGESVERVQRSSRGLFGALPIHRSSDGRCTIARLVDKVQESTRSVSLLSGLVSSKRR